MSLNSRVTFNYDIATTFSRKTQKTKIDGPVPTRSNFSTRPLPARVLGNESTAIQNFITLIDRAEHEL